jgi:hypothetical protein
MEAFSTHGNGTLTVVKEKSPTEFDVEQNVETMNGARTITLDTNTGHILENIYAHYHEPKSAGRRP